MTSASPTMTPVNALGAKNSTAAAATSSTVTASSRAGWSRSHCTETSSAASDASVEAQAAWLSSEISSEPTA